MPRRRRVAWLKLGDFELVIYDREVLFEVLERLPQLRRSLTAQTIQTAETPQRPQTKRKVRRAITAVIPENPYTKTITLAGDDGRDATAVLTATASRDKGGGTAENSAKRPEPRSCDHSNLPSFAKDNPWLAMLSRG